MGTLVGSTPTPEEDGLPDLLVSIGGSTANYYSNSSDAGPRGSAEMLVAACVQIRTPNADPFVVMAAGDRFFAGYSLGLSTDRPTGEITDGGGVKTNSNAARWWEQVAASGPAAAPKIQRKTAIMWGRYAAGLWDVGLDYDYTRQDHSTPGGYTGNSNPFYLGRQTNAADPWLGGIAWAAIANVADATVITDAIVWDWVAACQVAGDFVVGSIAFDHAWSFLTQGAVAGAAPATLEDLIGSADLTRAGSLTLVEVPQLCL